MFVAPYNILRWLCHAISALWKWWGKNRFAHKRGSIYRCGPLFWRFIAGQIPALSIFRNRGTIPVDSAAVAGETPNRSAASRQTNYRATDMSDTTSNFQAWVEMMGPRIIARLNPQANRTQEDFRNAVSDSIIKDAHEDLNRFIMELSAGDTDRSNLARTVMAQNVCGGKA
jgi:hypothetical protein